jgi:hypothetical protein
MVIKYVERWWLLANSIDAFLFLPSTSVTFIKLPKVNSHQMGEFSPNLVTLLCTQRHLSIWGDRNWVRTFESFRNHWSEVSSP